MSALTTAYAIVAIAALIYFVLEAIAYGRPTRPLPLRLARAVLLAALWLPVLAIGYVQDLAAFIRWMRYER